MAMRDKVLDTLVEEGVISRKQAKAIEERTTPDSTKNDVLARVAGEFDIEPQTIIDALADTAVAIAESEEEIEPRLPSFGERMGGVGEWVGDVADNITSVDEGEQARAEYRQRFIDAIDDAEEAGTITEDQATKWRKEAKWSGIEGEKVAEAYEEFIEAVPQGSVDDLKAANRAVVQPGHEYLPSSERARLETERSSFTADVAASQLSPSTWDDMLDQAGLINVDEDGTVQRATEAAHIGPGWFVDPATGQVYSQAEVDSYRDDIVRATTEGVDPNVAGSAAARLEEAISIPYYRKPDLMGGLGDYGRAGRMLEISGRDPGTGRTVAGRPQMPGEDLQIPTLLPDDPWEIPLYDYQTGQAQFMWANMSVEERDRWTNDMLKNGSLDPDEVSSGSINATSPYAMPQIEVLERAMYQSVYHQVNLREGLKIDGTEVARIRAAQSRANAVARAFSIPASLREIPGDKTLAQEAKDRFSRVLGREVLDDELTGLVGELKGYYEDSTQEKIALSLAAFNGDNQGLLTGAQLQQIEDPGAATSYDIEEKWSSEIDLNNRRESNADSFSRILNATMGGQVSVANRTAAGGVSQIAR